MRRWPVNKKRLEYCSTGASVLSILMRSGPNLFANTDPLIFFGSGSKIVEKGKDLFLCKTVLYLGIVYPLCDFIFYF